MGRRTLTDTQRASGTFWTPRSVVEVEVDWPRDAPFPKVPHSSRSENGGTQVRDLSKRIPGIEKLQLIEENSRHGNMEDPLEPMYLTH